MIVSVDYSQLFCSGDVGPICPLVRRLDGFSEPQLLQLSKSRVFAVMASAKSEISEAMVRSSTRQPEPYRQPVKMTVTQVFFS